MFVAQLDCSWLTTPFISRGFEINSDDEIELLRKFCKHVYVDIDRSSLADRKILKAHSLRSTTNNPFSPDMLLEKDTRPISFRHKVVRMLSRLDPTGATAARLKIPTHLRNSASTADEVPHAVNAYYHASEKMCELMIDVRKGKSFKLDRLNAVVIPLVESITRNPNALAWLGYLSKRDEGDFHYTITSAIWSVIMGRHMGFDQYKLSNLAIGSILLDIGNVKIPKSIGLKEGKLTPEEYEIVKMHVEYGMETVRKVSGLSDDAIAMVECHHECYDGSGYPRKLAGEKIPVFGRIAAVIDCYDAMITRTPFSAPKSPYDAICELNSFSGTRFQPEVVETFIRAVGMFPTGSLVELNTGEVGVVIEQNPLHRLSPKINLILNKKKKRLGSSKILDLDKARSTRSPRKARWIEKDHEPGAFEIDPKEYFFGTQGTE